VPLEHFGNVLTVTHDRQPGGSWYTSSLSPPRPFARAPGAQAMAGALRVLQRRLMEGAGGAATVMSGAGARSGSILGGVAAAALERLVPGACCGVGKRDGP